MEKSTKILITSFEKFNENKNWIKGAIKNEDALRKELGKKKGEKITKSEIDAELTKLKKKDKDKDKEGVQLNDKDAKTYKRLNLAKTLSKIKK